MHELPITQAILETALRYAPAQSQITAVHLVLGELAPYVDTSIQFYWEVISQGTPAAHAQLHFNRTSAQLQCRQCHTVYSLKDDHLTCPQCDSSDVVIQGGDEFLIDSIEVE